jgi:hypothetical protein
MTLSLCWLLHPIVDWDLAKSTGGQANRSRQTPAIGRQTSWKRGAQEWVLGPQIGAEFKAFPASSFETRCNAFLAALGGA